MKFTLITATLNSSHTIADCLQSVNSQTYPQVDQIIIDGHSTDETLEVIRSTLNRVSQIISEPDGGIYEAMNKGISQATGDVIGILNSDDLYIDDHVLQDVADQGVRARFIRQRLAPPSPHLFCTERDLRKIRIV